MNTILLDNCPNSNSCADNIKWMVLVLGNQDKRRYGFNEWAKGVREELIKTGEWIERKTDPGQIEIFHRSMAMN